MDTTYGLHEVKNLNKGDFKLFDTSRDFIQIEVVGIRFLKLPSNKVLELKICYYIFNIVRNIISVPLLLKQDFKIIAKNNDCSIFFSNEYYGSAFTDNSLMFLSLNDNMLHVENMKKRKRKDVNVTYLWHCRLGHINESRLTSYTKIIFLILMIMNHMKLMNLTL